MAILVSWLLCFIFTVTDVFPPEVDKYGYYARTDARQGILSAAPWFKIPYPCKCVYYDEEEEQEGAVGKIMPGLHEPLLTQLQVAICG